MQTNRAICAHDSFEVAGDFDGTLGAGTFTFKDDEDPLTSMSPPHVDLVLVTPQEETGTEVVIGISGCDEGGFAQLGAGGVIPFWWAVDSAVSILFITSPLAPVPSFGSSEREGLPSE